MEHQEASHTLPVWFSFILPNEMTVGWNLDMPKEFHHTSMQETSQLKNDLKLKWELLYWPFEQNKYNTSRGWQVLLISASLCRNGCWDLMRSVCLLAKLNSHKWSEVHIMHHTSQMLQIITIIGWSYSARLMSSANVQCPLYAAKW